MTGIAATGATHDRLRAEVESLRQRAQALQVEEDGLELQVQEAKEKLQGIRLEVGDRMRAGSPFTELKSLKGKEDDAQLQLEALQEIARARSEESKQLQDTLHRTLHELERQRVSVGEIRALVLHHRARVANAERHGQ